MSTAFGMSEEDKREIIADFLSESEQHIQTLNTYLLKAEELLKASQEIPDDQINMMFRAAHTIKGSSSMLGFENLSHLTHEMETVLDRVRSKKSPLTRALIEVLFMAFDSLNAILDKLRREGSDSLDVAEIVTKIKAVLTAVVEAPLVLQTQQEKAADVSDMGKYLPAFLEDTDGCVLRFNEILLGFEKGSFDPDRLNELFRLAHTIKGSAGIIKCKGIETVAHRMEDLLVDFRARGVKPTADVTALLFKGIDWIKSSLDALRKGSYQEGDQTEFLKPFKTTAPAVKSVETASGDVLAADPFSSISEEVKNKIRIALNSNHNIFKIIVSIKRNPMSEFKSAIIEERLKKAGTVLMNVQGESPESADLRLRILYATPSPKEGVRAFLLLDEVEMTSIEYEDFSFLRPAVEAPGSLPLNPETKAMPLEITTMKIDARKLDNLMNLAGELVITRARFAQLINEFDSNFSGKEVAARVYDLQEATSVLGKLSSDIQSAVMQTRMVPIEGIFSRFKRVVRDLSRDLGKDVNLELYGEETELDKKIIDALPDSLTHMIRNAVDHGIESRPDRVTAGKKETGTIKLKAFHQGNSICIEIVDDGKGLDAAKLSRKALEKGLVTTEQLARMDEKARLNFIFHPGFSTAEKVTGLSGRGVGMDVVKKMIESLSGTVDIETEVGQGSRFILKIPLTLAIIQALLVVINGQVYAFPLEAVSEIIKVSSQDIYSVDGLPMIKLRGHALGLLSMDKILGAGKEAAPVDMESKVVVVGSDGKYSAIKVNDLIGEEEIVIKALPDCFANVKGISGASILGDGSIALILDISSILREV